MKRRSRRQRGWKRVGIGMSQLSLGGVGSEERAALQASQKHFIVDFMCCQHARVHHHPQKICGMYSCFTKIVCPYPLCTNTSETFELLTSSGVLGFLTVDSGWCTHSEMFLWPLSGSLFLLLTPSQ